MVSLNSLAKTMTAPDRSRTALNERIKRVGQVLRRRTDDAIEEAFQHACLAGDQATASDLVAVLERKQERRIATNGTDRRVAGLQLDRMRAELIQREQD